MIFTSRLLSNPTNHQESLGSSKENLMTTYAEEESMRTIWVCISFYNILGLGKTLQMLCLILLGTPKTGNHPTLIVCPVTVIESGWISDINKHFKVRK